MYLLHLLGPYVMTHKIYKALPRFSHLPLIVQALVSWKLLEGNLRIFENPCLASEKGLSLLLWRTLSLNETQQKRSPTCKLSLQHRSPVWMERYSNKDINTLFWKHILYMWLWKKKSVCHSWNLPQLRMSPLTPNGCPFHEMK